MSCFYIIQGAFISAFDVLRDSLYSSIVVAETKGEAGKSDNNGVGGSKSSGVDDGRDTITCYDNIWLNPHTRAAFTGQWRTEIQE